MADRLAVPMLLIAIATLLAGVAIGVAAIVTPQWDAQQKANKPVVVQGFAQAPNGYDTLIENPSTTTYRILQVHFKVDERQPPDPSLKTAPIPTDTVVFTMRQFDPQRNEFRKKVAGIKMTANDMTNLQFKIIDPKHRGWLYQGTVTIYYDNSSREPIVLRDYPILVSAR